VKGLTQAEMGPASACEGQKQCNPLRGLGSVPMKNKISVRRDCRRALAKDPPKGEPPQEIWKVTKQTYLECEPYVYPQTDDGRRTTVDDIPGKETVTLLTGIWVEAKVGLFTCSSVIKAIAIPPMVMQPRLDHIIR